MDPWLPMNDALLVACAGAATDAQRTAAVASASEVLYLKSGRQFGTRTHTIRPSGGCGATEGVCGGSSKLLVLPGSPIQSITSVKVDGVTLAAQAYRWVDGSTLVRLDGLGWPCCQDLALPTTGPGSFEVVYVWGKPPTPLMVDAARELACELAKAKAGGQCRLPQRVVNVSRQGLSFSLPDLMEFLDKGRTGLYFVDLALSAVNPGGISRPATVASPDWPPRGGTP